MFFAAVKSNRNLLGTWFYTPASMTVFLVFTGFMLLDDAYRRRSTHYNTPLLALVSLASAITYPPALFVIASGIIVYALIHWKGVVRFLPALTALIILSALWVGSTLINWNAGELVHSNFLQASRGVVDYQILSFLGLAAAIPAILSLILLVEGKAPWTLFTPLILPTANQVIFFLTSNTLLIPYQRNVLYLLYFMAPLSAYGLHEALGWLSKTPLPPLARQFTSTTLMLAVFTLLFHGYFDLSSQKGVTGAQPWRLAPTVFLDDDALRLMQAIDELPPRSVVFTEPMLSATIYPLTRKNIIALPPGNLGLGDHRSFGRFMSLECENQVDTILSNRADYVITLYEPLCDNFTLKGIYGPYMLYETRWRYL